MKCSSVRGLIWKGAHALPASCPPTPVPSSFVSSTRSPGGDKHLDRSIWSPPPCWQTSFLSALAWPSGSQKLTWTPQRSTEKHNNILGRRPDITCLPQYPHMTNLIWKTESVRNSSYLASSRDFQTVHRSGYLNALNLAVLAALVPDILHNLLVFFIIQQLLGGHHVHKTQHLGGQTSHLSHGAIQTWHLQCHWGLIYTCLEGQKRVQQG